MTQSKQEATEQCAIKRIYEICVDSFNSKIDRIREAMGQTAPSNDTQWRCFHCEEAFTDRAAALEHFGPSQASDPACQINIAEYRRMEENNRRHCEEDTDLHRALHAKTAEMVAAVRQAEEQGYARGLEDAKKHPEELGLTRTEELELIKCLAIRISRDLRHCADLLPSDSTIPKSEFYARLKEYQEALGHSRDYVHKLHYAIRRLEPDALRWQALIGCARITAMGSAGLAEPKEDGYAHLTVNLWTKHSAESEPYAVKWLRQFADIAVRVMQEKELPLPEREYLVLSRKYSNEGYALWWRPNACGYTNNLDCAGRYTKEEAEKIVRGSDRGEEIWPAWLVETAAVPRRMIDMGDSASRFLNEKRNRDWLQLTKQDDIDV